MAGTLTITATGGRPIATRVILVMVVPYDCHYTDDDEIDTNQVVEYLGKNHNNETEYEAGYPHP